MSAWFHSTPQKRCVLLLMCRWFICDFLSALIGWYSISYMGSPFSSCTAVPVSLLRTSTRRFAFMPDFHGLNDLSSGTS